MGSAEYLRIIRRRWWLIAALLVIGAGVAWVSTPSSKSESPTTRFRASTLLERGPSEIATPASAANLNLAASLVQSPVVVERSAAELRFPAAELADGLAVSINDKAGTLQISTVDSDAARAASEADTIAAQLMIYLGERGQAQLAPLIDSTSARIKTLEDRVNELNSQIARPDTAQVDVLRAERDSVVRQLSASYDRLQQLTAQSTAAGTQLVVLTPAAATREAEAKNFSVPDSETARAVLGASIGLVVGLALALALERLNPKIRTIGQAELAFGLPVIAEIPRASRWQSRRRAIASFAAPHSATAECFRKVRTALVFTSRVHDGDRSDTEPSSQRKPFDRGHVVLVTSAMPGEGKTTVVANLAAGFAENSGDVLVLSADPRRPAIESMLLKRQGAAAKLASSSRPDAVLTTVPGVKLVRACDPDTNPASIVTYERQVALRGRANSQVVIIDTPPALVANDATELMHAADSTLLVARAGVTTVAAAQRVAELLSRHGVAAVGVVLIGVASPAMASSGYYRKEQRQAQRSTPRRTGEHSKPKGRKRAAEPVGRRIVDLTDLDEIPPAAPAPRPAPRLFGREGDPSREPPTADRDGPHGNEGASTTRYGDGNGHGAWAPSSPRTEPAEQAGSWSSSE